jgi:NADPH-dependent 2,4-dienoyl-CoA reductase/sulfur reductase-like enzyme/rhodanese-related sulfurtransferase
MLKQNNIVIIGGTACGPKAAARARRCDPSARITIIEQRRNLSTATCGLPYFISGTIKSENALVARPTYYFQEVTEMEVLIGTQATAIKPQDRQIEILDLEKNSASSIEYDKLVIATGSRPVVPNLEGKDLTGIFMLNTIPDAYAIRNYIANAGNAEVVVVGAGLIGMEMAEAFAARGLNVTIIEALDRVLPSLLDFEVSAYLEKHLKSRGIKVICGQPVKGFLGDNGIVRRVATTDKEIEATLVLMALGVKPEVSLAKAAGLKIGAIGGISVNERLQTSDPAIYAGGDCVELVNLVTGKKVLVPMGSTANKHGRVIGTNVTGGDETFTGVMGTTIAKVFNFNVGRTGLTEAQAIQDGYEVTTALVPTFEHATYYPGAKEILIKLIAEKSSGKILGGQAAGMGDTAKRIDVLATAMTFGATVEDMALLDLAYAPPYNSAMDPLHNAANVIRNKKCGLGKSITPIEVKKKLDNGEHFVFLDVRSPAEWKIQRIEAPQVKFIPLPELKKRAGEFSPEDEIIVFCRTSIRAYQAQRILDGAGFKNVKFMDGSVAGWPYETVSNSMEK